MDQETEDKVYHIPRMTEKERLDFVQRFLADKIFTSEHLTEDPIPLIGTIFMPIGLGVLSSIPKKILREELGIVWEDLSKAGPVMCNGYPSFFSVNLMHIDDWIICLEAIVEMKKHLDNLDLSGDKHGA